MKNLKHSIIFKISIIFILILILMIPTSMIKGLVHERERVQQNAINEVSEKWSMGQTITGPYLSIPYDKYVKRFSKKDSTEKVVKIKEWLHFLPEELTINGRVDPEKRHRGIYEVVVYQSHLGLEGSFKALDIKSFDIDPKNIHFDKATINIGITDLKGIEKQISVKWKQDSLRFNSGTSTQDIVSSGIHAPVKVELNDSIDYSFSLAIDLKGSQHLYFTPLGKTTNIQLNSNWPTPSFTGQFIPDSHVITAKGFDANWNVIHLNRNYPQSWIGSNSSVQYSSFGTDLLLPVDNYKKSYRVARYAILFLVLTFLVFFFVEVLNKVFIHPIQYLLVGIALVVFYTLLLSLSEHMLFNYAYIVSTILTLILITSYTTAILKSRKIGMMIFGILLLMYTFIFTIIQMEDYALLIGSIGLFAILAVVMFFSRKIDWYAIRLGQKDKQIE